MILATANTAIMVTMVRLICFRVARKVSHINRAPAFCTTPPMMAATKITTPGVLTQLKEVSPAVSAVLILKDEAN